MTVLPKLPIRCTCPVEPSTRPAISVPSSAPSCSTWSAPARPSTSTLAHFSAVTAMGTSPETCRTVKATLVFAVSERVEATSFARSAPALRYV